MERDTNREERFISRRKMLRAGSTGAVLGGISLAGCLGDEGGEENGSENGGDGNEENGDQENGGENGDEENGDQDSDDGNGDEGNGNEENGADEDEWIQLFNGEDLDDWTPTFVGYEPGENYNNTFRVEDGILEVNYDEWDGWEDGLFGHLSYDGEFSHYIVHAEYRFLEGQPEGGPDWAFRNNGLMLLSEHAEDMGVEKDFPRSVEFQFLGEEEGTENGRPNGDLCTPDTHAHDISGELVTDHCWGATEGSVYTGDDWVTAIGVVRGGEFVQHILGDDGIVLEYQDVVLEEDESLVESGTISVQAESHPAQFRTIELFELDPNEDYVPGEIPEPAQEKLDG